MNISGALIHFVLHDDIGNCISLCGKENFVDDAEIIFKNNASINCATCMRMYSLITSIKTTFTLAQEDR